MGKMVNVWQHQRKTPGGGKTTVREHLRKIPTKTKLTVKQLDRLEADIKRFDEQNLEDEEERKDAKDWDFKNAKRKIENNNIG